MMTNAFYFVCWFAILSNQLMFLNADPLIGTSTKIKAPYKTELDFIVSISWKNTNAIIDDRHVCGGSLITKQHVLTAAHCKPEPDRLMDLTVKVGHNLRIPEGEYDISTWRNFEENFCPLFDRDFIKRCNDIGVIKLTTKVTQTIRLPGLNFFRIEELWDKDAVTAGWGCGNSDFCPIMLQKVDVKIINTTECEKNVNSAPRVLKRKNGKYRKEFKLTSDTVCSNFNRIPGDRNSFVTLGQGDSGSPLVISGSIIIAVNEATVPEEGVDYNHYEQILHTTLLPYKKFIYNEIRR